MFLIKSATASSSSASTISNITPVVNATAPPGHLTRSWPLFIFILDYNSVLLIVPCCIESSLWIIHVLIYKFTVSYDYLVQCIVCCVTDVTYLSLFITKQWWRWLPGLHLVEMCYMLHIWDVYSVYYYELSWFLTSNSGYKITIASYVEKCVICCACGMFIQCIIMIYLFFSIYQAIVVVVTITTSVRDA